MRHVWRPEIGFVRRGMQGEEGGGYLMGSGRGRRELPPRWVSSSFADKFCKISERESYGTAASSRRGVSEKE